MVFSWGIADQHPYANAGPFDEVVHRQNDLYDSYMTELAVSKARDHLAEIIEQSRQSGEPVFVTRRGRRVAVIIDAEAYERVVETAEETTDRWELQAARAENDYVPWDEVKADLGLE